MESTDLCQVRPQKTIRHAKHTTPFQPAIERSSHEQMMLQILHITSISYRSFLAFALCFLGSPRFFLSFLSPSASHLLACTSWTTLTHCLKSMTGAEPANMIHGMLESILLARAYSIAAALKGLEKKYVGVGSRGDVGVVSVGSFKAGVMRGELKQRR